MSQATLGDCASCAVITIKKLEAGERRPSRALALMLAACLQIPLEEREGFVLMARGETGKAADLRPPLISIGAPPARLNRFVGREQELAGLHQLIVGDGRRLVTILGAPGVGKTRLALEISRRVAARFPDGVKWIDLSAVNDSAAVAPTIRRTLRLPDAALPWRSDLDQLLLIFAEARVLFVLDNCEQVGNMAVPLSTLLAGIPGLTIVATSRQPLQLHGEQAYPLQPLPGAEGQGAGAALPSPAAQLFITRARDMAPSFQPSAEQRAQIEALCRRMDGLPLAIELAAAQLRYQSLPSLLSIVGWEGPLDLSAPAPLAGEPLTLRFVLERSYRRLAPEQQALFARLSLFVNGWSAAAAAEFGPRQALHGLVDASLVYLEAEPPGERYRMLETTRSFATEKLAALGDVDSARDAHAGYFARVAASAAAEFHTPHVARWQAQLGPDRANFELALQWHRARAPRIALEMAVNLWEFWYLWGEYRSGIDHLSALLDKVPQPDLLRANALRAAGVLYMRLGEFSSAHPLLAESLRVASAVADEGATANAHMGLGDYLNGTGNMPAARPHYEAALAIFSTLDNALGRSWAMGGLARVALLVDGDRPAANALLAHCVSEARVAGDPRHLGWMLALLADFLRESETPASARPAIVEALECHRSVRDRPGRAYAHLRLGALCREEGRQAEALDHLQRAAKLALHAGTPSYAAQALALLAVLAHADGDDPRSIRLFAAASEAYPELRARLPTPDRAMVDKSLAALRHRAGKSTFDRRWEEGRRLSMARALANHAGEPQAAPAQFGSNNANRLEQLSTGEWD